jgi:predicted permease
MFWRRRSSKDFAEEIKSHLELETDDLRREGFSQDEARRRARVEFGSVQSVEERFHTRHRVVWLDNFLRDIKFALRQLLKNPGFAATAVLVLALGIGASVAIFAFVDAALIRPLPYADPTRLVHVTEKETGISRVNISYLDYLDWKRLNNVLSSMDVFGGWNLLLSTPTGTESVPAVRVSTAFFGTLGIVPALGRDFYPAEQVSGGPHVVMLSYGSWERRFGLREDIIGTSVRLDGVSYSVIGVLPKGFQFALTQPAEFWAPLQPANHCEGHRDCHNLYAVGRLKDGVSVQAALANLQSIAQQLERQYPDTNHGRGASVMPLSEAVVGEIRPILLMLLAGAGLLLLIACVNVSGLLVAHTEHRRREIAVRGALGASRTRIAAQLLTEGMVLVIAGALAGLLFAAGAMQILTLLISKQLMAGMPWLLGARLSTHELEFAAMLVLLAAILLSIMPILHLLSCDVREALTDSGRAMAGSLWRRVGRRLVVIELATTVVLLSAAGLLGKSLYLLLHVDVGFQTDHLATLIVRLPDSAFPTDPQQAAFARSVIDRTENLPGVRAAAITTRLPVTCGCDSDWLRIVGRPYDGGHITVNERHVSSGFFATLHTRLLTGRYFTDAEDSTKPRVVIINHTFARQFFPGEDPVGKTLGDPTLSPSSLRQIVGVIADFKDGSLDENTQEPAEYLPFNQNPASGFNLVVRTAQDERTILSLLAATIHELNKDVGVEQGSTMNDVINDSPTTNLHRTTAYLVGGFAALALLLSAVGIYGTIAYSVSRRTREIGVRMALGAHRSTVHRMVLADASRLAAIGIASGLVGSIAAARLLRGLLFGVHAWDLSTLAAVVAVLGIVTLVASYVPARRAASVNPVDALRNE